MTDHELPVELTSMTPGPLRTALETYHNTNSGHYERMEAVVAALAVERLQETKALRAEVETLRRDAERWRLAKEDVNQWGSALNSAAWAQLDAYRSHIGETESAKFFNFGKSMLRESISAYLSAIDATMKDHP